MGSFGAGFATGKSDSERRRDRNATRSDGTMAAASMRCRAVLVATLSVALLLTASRVEANSGAVGRRVLLSMADTAAQTISLDESVVNEDMNLAPEMNDTAGNMTEMANDTIADDENFAWGNL